MVNISTEELAKHSHSASTNTIGNHQHYTFNNDETSATGYNQAVSSNNYPTRFRGNTGNNSENYMIGGSRSTPVSGLTNIAGNHSHTVTIQNTGSNSAHENRQPYIVVYRFCRTN